MTREEEEYLRQVKSTKPRICTPPLYKLAGSGKRNYQDGGFLTALLPILRVAGPFILDYAMNKFTGDGLEYRHTDKTPLNDEEKRLIILKILVEYPHLSQKLFS